MTHPPELTQDTPQGCSTWPSGCSAMQASPGARSIASPSAWVPARSPACVWAWPPRAASHSHSASSSSACPARSRSPCPRSPPSALTRSSLRTGVRALCSRRSTPGTARCSPPSMRRASKARRVSSLRRWRCPRRRSPATDAAGGESLSLLAVGDGAVRFRAELQDAGAHVEPDSSPLHLISAGAVCALGALADAQALQEILPDYRRRPDAELALEGSTATGGA